MHNYAELHAHLSMLESDAEVVHTLLDFFAGFCEVASVSRFQFSETPSKRNFLIEFKDSANMLKARSHCNLRSFGFDCALVELDKRFQSANSIR